MNKMHMRRRAYVALAMTLLVLSLLLVACGGNNGTSNNNPGNSNITTNGQSTTSQSTPSGTIQSINQQVQNGVQSIDNAQNDVNTADATATAESGGNQQP